MKDGWDTWSIVILVTAIFGGVEAIFWFVLPCGKHSKDKWFFGYLLLAIWFIVVQTLFNQPVKDQTAVIYYEDKTGLAGWCLDDDYKLQGALDKQELESLDSYGKFETISSIGIAVIIFGFIVFATIVGIIIFMKCCLARMIMAEMHRHMPQWHQPPPQQEQQPEESWWCSEEFSRAL